MILLLLLYRSFYNVQAAETDVSLVLAAAAVATTSAAAAAAGSGGDGCPGYPPAFVSMATDCWEESRLLMQGDVGGWTNAVQMAGDNRLSVARYQWYDQRGESDNVNGLAAT